MSGNDSLLFVMLYLKRIPRHPLSVFIDSIWIYDGAQRPHHLERILPTGTASLVINLRDDIFRTYDRRDVRRFQTHPGCLLAGPSSEFFLIDTEQQQSVMGVSFKAGGAFPFLGMPAVEVSNRHWALELIWGRAAAAELRERVLEVRTPDLQFDAAETVLSKRLELPHYVNPSVDYALGCFRAGSAYTVSGVTERIGLSPRRFIQIFGNQVGLTPKTYCRVTRFQRVLRRVHGRRQVAWADLAVDCGYFDQAHFIRDFRAFTGMNPSEFLAGQGEYPNHVPIAS